MTWKLKSCQRCGGDLLASGWDGSWSCLQCGADASRNGAAPAQRQKPRAPTGAERLAAVYERFLAKLAAEGEA